MENYYLFTEETKEVQKIRLESWIAEFFKNTELGDSEAFINAIDEASCHMDFNKLTYDEVDQAFHDYWYNVVDVAW